MRYNPQEIEKKWRARWIQEKIYEPDFKRAKHPFYNLMMFPYPSAEGLHIGSVRTFTGVDIYGRFKRMQGYNVFEPIGLDGFGIHSENYALKTGRHPAEQAKITEKNFYRQLGEIGNGFAWKEKLETYDPEYYRWTQWIFVQMFKNGLAYRKKAAVNWCPSCLTVLADEQVIKKSKIKNQKSKVQFKIQNDRTKTTEVVGVCERCETAVVKKELEQWFFKITDYAERLLKNLEKIDWLEHIKTAQRNWIGKSEGAIIKFKIQNSKFEIPVFTTRPDTLFGATYLVLAPEHPLLNSKFKIQKSKLQFKIKNWHEVESYIKNSLNKTDEEGVIEGKEKTGVELKGIKAVNPASGEEIPIFVADYILGGVGTGAIMAVPAHDQRDFEFAKKFGLPIKEVIRPVYGEPHHGAEFRRTITAIVQRPSDGKFLAVKWKKFGWLSLPIGGVNKNETGEAAAVREVLEETGYKVKPVKKLGGKIIMHFFAENKNVWRHRLDQPILLELIDSTPLKRSVKETGKLDVLWIDGKELLQKISHEYNAIGVRRHLGMDGAYEGSGEIIHSGKFDGMPSEKARDEITRFVGGKKKVQYRLRDWLISRQRYWGPPIPMIYCEKCAKTNPKILLVHGISGSNKENWFPWFKNEMQSRGYEVLMPNLPNKDHPKLSEWVSALRSLGFNKNDKIYVVGHSLGAPAACKFISQAGLKVEKLILVAPTGKSQNKKNWENLHEAGIGQEGIEIIKKFNEQNTKLKNLKRLVGEAVIYLSDNDPFIPLNVAKDYKELDCRIKIFKKRGHFNQSAGIKELPEILEDFPSVESFNLGWQPVPEKDLPIKLPYIKDFRPTGTDKSPLATVEKFYKVRCPKCKSWARRETDVSDTFLDSAWYYLGYLILGNQKPKTKNQKPTFPQDIIKKWLPVDMYIGGAEHAVLHLLYARFAAMALHDLGYLHFEEPFKKFRAHGLIIKGGAKMSKSLGNVVNPDEYIRAYGADAIRMHLAFLAPLPQGGDFRDEGIRGITRFLERVWKFGQSMPPAKSVKGSGPEILRGLNEAIKKVTEDTESLQYNTAISALMVLLNEFEKRPETVSKKPREDFLKLLAPFAPHLAEEIWRGALSYKTSVHKEKWPKFNPDLLKEETREFVIQINGKLRGTVKMRAGAMEAEVKGAALSLPNVKKYLAAEPRKVIFVPDKLINFVI